MKIGLVIYGSLYALSGGYMYDRRLVEYLREHGDSVEIISLPWRNYAVHLTDNLSFKLPYNLDILIQDELNHPSLIGANRREHPYPIISLVHHLRCSELRPKWQNDFYRSIEKIYLRSVDGFIFNSKTTREAVNRLAGKGRHEIVAYPPTDRFGRAIPQEEIQTRSTQNPLRILFLGNVIERKGLHTLLKAVTCQPTDIRLDVVGSLASEPEYAGKMRRFVMVNELESIVTFHSALDSQPLIDRLRQAHVLIVPSSYEGFGIVYLEGMCFGLPCIGTTKGAAREIIENERTGYLIQPNDHEALAVRIASLAEDRTLLAQLSLNARDRYNRQPSWNETASHLRAFLQGLIG